MNRLLLILSFTLLVGFMFGCANGLENPVTPPQNSDSTPTAIDQNTLQTEFNKGHSLLGYYEMYVDPETFDVEFLPMRTAETHLNMVPVLESGKQNVGLAGPPSVQNGVLSVDVKIIHPYNGILNLSGFDVKGILITEGSETGFGDPAIRIAGPNQTRLINADGFTRWWNPVEFTKPGWVGYTQGKLGTVIPTNTGATLNGYKLFADALGPNDSLTDLDPATRALFTAGNTNVRHYDISLKSGLKFNYAVDISWAPPTVKPPVNLPDDFPIEANQQEPWYIKVVELNNTLWFEGSEHGGNVSYMIYVYDWQGVGDIQAMHLYIPGISFVGNYTTPTETTPEYCAYQVEILLPNLTSNTDLDTLVVVDVPGGYDQASTGVSAPLRAYHRHITEVSDSNPMFNTPPVAIMQATTPTDIYAGESVSFDASASYDPDGVISDYKWDFNNDGIFGDSYSSGSPSKPTKIFNNPGIFQVKVRVIDDKSSSTTSSAVTVNVTLETNDPPVAVAIATTDTNILEDNSVSFDASGSYDVDGTIVNYQWDFNGDGVFGDPFTGDMVTPTAMFPNPGTFNVDLKVTDDQNATGTLAQKIKIEVEDIPNVKPNASAQATTSTNINLCGSVTFDASASTDDDGTIASYLWDFNGDGTYGDPFDSGTPVNPTKVFSAAGNFNVDLKVVDDEGAEDTLDSKISVTVTNQNPTASAIATTPTTIFGGQSVTFDATGSSDPNSSCGDKIAQYAWDFNGDGNYGDTFESGTQSNPVKTFTANGQFNVSLRVTDNFGGTDVIDDPIVVTVNNNPPTACAEITSTFPYFWKTDIGFSGSCSSDADGTITLYEWDLDADGSYEKTGMNVTYYFEDAGQHTMQLRVTDNEGATSTLATPISFNIFDDSNMPPTVTAVNHSRTTSRRGDTTESVSLNVEFDDPIPPGDTHTYLWTCDKGTFDGPTNTTSTLPNPVWYPPNEVCKPIITVRVTDAQGMWDEGTCKQWVTQYPVITGNPNAPDNMIISQVLQTCFGKGPINPRDFKWPEAGGDGNVVYMNFWATWCGPCVNEMDELKEIYDMYKDFDYIHLGMDLNETQSQVENFVNTHVCDASYWVLCDSSYFLKCYYWSGQQNAIPTHYVFDRDGRIRAQRVGSLSSINDLTKYIDQLI